MERRERERFVSPTEETVPLEEERAIAAPRFDEKSIQRARPAVPLTLGRKVGSWPLAVVLLCVLGGVAGGVLGGLALTLYQRGGSRVASESVRSGQESGGAVAGASANAGASTSADAGATVAPQTVNTSAGADGQAPAAAAVAQQSASAQTPMAADGMPGQERTATEAPRTGAGSAAEADGAEAPADASTQGELRAALEQWVAATNSRDVGRQMSFYAPNVEAFYLSRNASRETVRAEKSRLFAAAQSVNVQAAPPDIRLSRDGRTAVMRFRKRYQITGGEASRSGEVLQELRWRRTPGGWKIVGERDLRVLQ